MTEIEIPAPVCLDDGHLETGTVVEIAIPDYPDVLTTTAIRYRVGKRIEPERGEQKQSNCKSASFHRDIPGGKPRDRVPLA
jgi:hypothetical protein